MPNQNEQPMYEEMPAEDSTGAASDAGNVLMSWEYPEYHQFERGLWWYVIASIILVALLIYSYFSDNPLFIIIIILSVVIFVLANARQPLSFPFFITDKGLIIKDKFIHYADITNFWLIYQPPQVKTLFIEPKSMFTPRLHIHLGDQDPREVRNLLKQFLTEDVEKEEEPQSETIGRLLKF